MTNRGGTYLLGASIACALLALGWFVLNGQIESRADRARAADIRAHGVPVTAEIIGIVRDRSEKLQKIRYRVGEADETGAVGCRYVQCDPAGTPIAITADLRHPDRFITPDGRMYIANAPNYHFLRMLLGAWLIIAAAVFFQLWRQTRPQRPDRGEIPDVAVPFGGYSGFNH